MKTANTMPTVTIATSGGDAEVIFTANMRFADFFQHNGYKEVDIANEHYKTAKKNFAELVEKELSTLRAIDAKQSVVFKGGAFKVRTTLVKEQDADCDKEQHTTLVKQWAQKKAVESQKAQERASVFLAMKNQVAKAA